MTTLQDVVVLIPFIILLSCCIILTFLTRFIQIRAIPRMFALLFQSFFSTKEGAGKIKAHKALFTAMATTIGVGNIVGPIIAVGIGGPGTLVGYMLATFFGAAATFAEVTFAQKYQDPTKGSDKIGGAMYYLRKVIPLPFVGLYAFAGFIMLLAWSGMQSNALSIILSVYYIPPIATGALLAGITLAVLIGGIKRVGAIAELMVPAMFIMYISAVLWIIASNLQALPAALSDIFTAAFTPQKIGGGISIAALVTTFRWGLARGFHSNESGLGTAAIPHAKAEATSPVDQGMLAVLSVFANGLICILTGLCFIVTGMHTSYGEKSVTLLTNLFSDYLPGIGPVVLIVSMALFVVSTVIGNSYNGSELFRYALGKKQINLYYVFCAASIFLGSLFSVDQIALCADILALPVIIPHSIGLVMMAFAYKSDLTSD